MPVLYREIERQDVVNLLLAKGYGIHQTRHYAIAVNKPTGKQFQSGSMEKVFAWGVREEQYDLIMKHADSPEDAVRRLEASGLGVEQFAPPSEKGPNAQPGLTLELAEKLIVNRVAAEVSRVVEPFGRVIEALRAELAEANKAIGSLAELVGKMPKRMGRPKGSRNKPKDAPPAP